MRPATVIATVASCAIRRVTGEGGGPRTDCSRPAVAPHTWDKRWSGASAVLIPREKTPVCNMWWLGTGSLRHLAGRLDPAAPLDHYGSWTYGVWFQKRTVRCVKLAYPRPKRICPNFLSPSRPEKPSSSRAAASRLRSCCLCLQSARAKVLLARTRLLTACLTKLRLLTARLSRPQLGSSAGRMASECLCPAR